MTQFSFEWILSLNCLSQNWGQVQKPANVLLKIEESPITTAPLAKLADLGISRALEGPGSTRLTQTGSVPGTLYFIAPEIVSGKLYGPTADVYSAGVTAYYILSGKYPYDFPPAEAGDIALLCHLVINDPNPIQERLPGIPTAVAAVINRACCKDPALRYPSALEFSRELVQARNLSMETATH